MVQWHGAASACLIGGGLSYLLGTIVVTVVCNVPLNDAVAAMNPTGGNVASLWADNARQWTAWNHVRTISGIVAAALFLIAISL